ncbi:MAG: hypothetical protein WAR37_01375 [Candidatus Microsaccharimonas sp.]
MIKKRNHKKAVVNRRARLKAESKARLWSGVIEAYSNGSDVMPMPTLVDALSNINFDKNETIQAGIKSQTEYFEQYIQKSSVEFKLGVKIPNKVITFIIPLDFYLALPEPYNAMLLSVDGENINRANCVTVVSEIIKVGESAVKTSYLIVGICMDDFSEVNDAKNKLISNVYEKAIQEANNVIAGFQTIVSRHNHYVHIITTLSGPSQIDMLTFDRRSGEKTPIETFKPNGNVMSEIYQSRPLEIGELNEFRLAHVNKSFRGDRIFDLVGKFNEAVNTRCFGHDTESIVLIDNFAELVMGYIYCQILIARGENEEEAVNRYQTFAKIGELISALSSIFEVSKTSFEKQIGYGEWRKYCRSTRNKLTHLYIEGKVGPDESLHALYYSGEMVRKLCLMASIKYKSNIEIFDKMTLLANSTYFTKVLHKGRFGES